jgi:type IX secretion system substrate protein
MMKKFLISTFLLFASSLWGMAQDTLNVMHYNILNYGNYTSYCTSNNNNIDTKTANLRIILDYQKPDVFSVNEMACNEVVADKLLDEALNQNGIDYYQRAEAFCTTSLSNMVFFNSNKVALHSQDYVSTNVREINIYKFYHLAEDLHLTNDTIFFHCIVAHLKAGDGISNEIERTDEITKLFAHLESNYMPGNFLFMGDMNLYSNTEDAFKKIISTENEFLFCDPINRNVNWHNNESCADIHTQSTHSGGGCAAGGGMDDRFDFIFVSDDIKNNLGDIHYLPGSYNAIGQDGQHFNKSLTDYPTNTTVPSPVLNALYNMSDHLPIVLKLTLGNGVGITENMASLDALNITSPAHENVDVRFTSDRQQELQINIYNLQGSLLFTKQMFAQKGKNQSSLTLSSLKKGFYILNIESEKGQISEKLIKY